MEGVAALAEPSRDRALPQRASAVVDNDSDGARRVQAHPPGRAARRGRSGGAARRGRSGGAARRGRSGFAVRATQPGSVRAQLAGNVVLKEVTYGPPTQSQPRP
jgi:hypothetical protein